MDAYGEPDVDAPGEPNPLAVPGTVLIAVPTFRRNDELASLLPLLLREAATVSPGASVLVIDNNPEADARAIATAAGVGYHHEAQPGITAARNAALDAATGHRFLVFIDDDEHPCDAWLATLLAAILATGGAAVAGPVISEFDVPPGDWVVASRFFQRKRRPTGTPMPTVATNNLVLDVSQLGALRFDDRLGLTGGEDDLFIRSLVAHGGRVSWCDEAIVLDRVPASRSTPQWVRRRARSMANTEVVVMLLVARSSTQRLAVRGRSFVRGVARIGFGLAQLVVGVLTRRLEHRARGARLLARGAGQLNGAIGVRHAEYSRS